MAHGKTRAQLDSDRQLNLALTRLLEIIGEAAARTPQEDAPATLQFRGYRSSGYAIDSFTATTQWISRSFDRLSPATSRL